MFVKVCKVIFLYGNHSVQEISVLTENDLAENHVYLEMSHMIKLYIAWDRRYVY